MSHATFIQRPWIALLVGLLLTAWSPPLCAGEEGRTYDRLLREADAAYQRGDHPAALGLYDEATALDPTKAKPHYMRGQIFRLRAREGDTGAAISAYERYLEIKPDGQGADEARGHIRDLRAMVRRQEEAREAATARLEQERRAEATRLEEERRAETARAQKQRQAEEKRSAPPAPPKELPAPAGRRIEPGRASPERDEPSPRRRPAKATWIAAPVVIGVGTLAAFGVGSGLYLTAKADNERFRSTCAPTCDRAAVEAGRSRELGAYGAFAVGGALAATELILWLVLPRGRRLSPRAWWSPTVGGAVVGGEF